MAKNPKKSQDAAAAEIGTEASIGPTQGVESTAAAETSAVVKSRATRGKSSSKRAGAATRKGAIAAKPRKAAPRNKPPVPAEVAVSEEAIRLRAYFISQWRMQNGVAGDSANDWLEARRQLHEEASKSA